MEASSYTKPAHVARRAKLRRSQRRRRLATFAVVVLPVGVAAALWLPTRHSVMRGVSVGGVDIGGLSKERARATLAAELGARLRRPVVVHTGVGRTTVVPARMGVKVDLQQTVEAAYGKDRTRAWLEPFLYSLSLDPVLQVPASLHLPHALLRVSHPPRDARLSVSPSGAVSVQPGRAGVAFNARGAYETIAAAAIAGRHEVSLRPERTQPTVTTAMAESTAAAARTVLSAPVRLRFRGRDLGGLTQAELAPLLTVVRTATGFRLGAATERLADAVAADVRSLNRDPTNAIFRIGASGVRIVPGHPGRGLDAVRTARSVIAAGLLPPGSRNARVFLTTTEPDRTAADARRLGIRQVVASATTDMGSSSPNRIWNVHLMADKLNGHVIEPGSTFSFNDTVGERTAARGFREGQAIVNGLLIPSIGGGVCQVASTLFGAAFSGGYPVVERTNHSFYISHYGPGMDATVSWGGPDFKFRNDSRYGILIRMSYTDATLTASFYSTSRGLTVERQTGEPSSYTDPKKRYVKDPTLTAATTRQQTIGERGFDVTVHRTVRQGTTIFREDEFRSHYVPEDIEIDVGPDFKPPAGTAVEAAPPTET